MTDYDLLVLSPVEFEDITKDLLEEKLQVSLENFGVGKDGGIDLRYSKSKANDLIIQCKRYKSYTSLKAVLKKEKSKIAQLKPRRYLLATTVELNPARKAEIIELLHPFIKRNGDIYGRSEINSLIGKYPAVEKRHYKLWLSSTAVLVNVLHSKVANQSELALQNIKQNLATYAETPSYAEALQVLQDNHFVIISGLPGIGKTTLARVLVYRLLGDKKFDEFVFVSGSVDEAYEMFNERKKQLFLFDDFLGTNFLEQKIGRNEDSRLLEFMKLVGRSKHTALILTTREYILRQAQSMFRQLDDGVVKNGKYIIDLSGYTKLVKARILYNHLFAAQLPADYLAEFLKQKVYKEIVNHDNYNPRLIEVVLNERPWAAFSVAEFPKAMVGYFDKPYRIWQNIYDNEISEHARSVLEVLFTATAPLRLEDLVTASRRYLRSKHKDTSRAKIERALKELDGTFISSEVSRDEVIITYQNPSVYDFLYEYYNSARQEDLCDVVREAEFLNQLTGIFTCASPGKSFVYPGKMIVQDALKAVMVAKVLRDFPNLEWSVFNRSTAIHLHNLGIANPRKLSLAEKAYKVLFDLNLAGNAEIDQAMLAQYKLHLASQTTEVPMLTESLELLEYFGEHLDEREIEEAVSDVSFGIVSAADIEEVDAAELYYPFAYEKLVASPHFVDNAEDALLNEVAELDDERVDSFLDSMMPIADKFGLNLMHVEEALEERRREAMAEIGLESDFYHEHLVEHPQLPLSSGERERSEHVVLPSEDEVIDGIFGSLR